MKKKRIAVCLLALIILLSIAFRNDISIVYKSLFYKREIDYAKRCVELLADGNASKLRSIFVNNASFFSRPEYIKQTTEFLKGVEVRNLKLRTLSFGKEGSKEVMFLHLYTEGSGEAKNIYLKFLKQSDVWSLYSLTVG